MRITLQKLRIWGSYVETTTLQLNCALSRHQLTRHGYENVSHALQQRYLTPRNIATRTTRDAYAKNALRLSTTPYNVQDMA